MGIQKDTTKSNEQILKSNNNTLKSNKDFCYYCGNELGGSRRYFCSNACLAKYWGGVYRKKWKEGDYQINISDKPTKEDLEKEKLKYHARRLAYKKLKSGARVNCDLCGIKLGGKNHINRHHDDYNHPEIFMVVCRKCHGWIKKYNNLKKSIHNIIQKEVK